MKTMLTNLLSLTITGLVFSGCSASKTNDEIRSVLLQHGVEIELVKTPIGLWVGETEVTQSQWEAVMGNNPAQFKEPNNPVETVSWGDCQTFLEKLNDLPSVKESGLAFRLPTDEEWEYACRAGATGDFCKLGNGTEITESTLGMVAWFEDNSDKQPHAVGQKEPNAFGVYDMIGNVHEWTQTADGESKVFCGGGWNFSAEFCKASSKAKLLPSYRSDSFGFRLCADNKKE